MISCQDCPRPVVRIGRCPPRRCPECRSAHQKRLAAVRRRRFREKNPERWLTSKAQANRNHYERNKEQYRRNGLAWHDRNKGTPRMERRWRANLYHRYGLTVDQYEALLDLQRGVCAICERQCKTGKRLAIDHDHATGEIRGLLCAFCNLHIALPQDFLRRAAAYLEAPPARSRVVAARPIIGPIKKSGWRRHRALDTTDQLGVG